MKTTTILTMFVALAATTGAVSAKPKGKVPRPAPPLLLPVLDTDKDGELSADEIANASAALLELDKNDDGQLTPREILPKKPKGKKKGKGKRPGPPILVRTIDLDGDRVLSADEIENAADSLLTLDRDGDGALSRKEMRPTRPGDAEV